MKVADSGVIDYERLEDVVDLVFSETVARKTIFRTLEKIKETNDLESPIQEYYEKHGDLVDALEIEHPGELYIISFGDEKVTLTEYTTPKEVVLALRGFFDRVIK